MAQIGVSKCIQAYAFDALTDNLLQLYFGTIKTFTHSKNAQTLSRISFIFKRCPFYEIAKTNSKISPKHFQWVIFFESYEIIKKVCCYNYQHGKPIKKFIKLEGLKL